MWESSPLMASTMTPIAVTSHQAYGLGVYAVFNNSTDACYNAIETPTNQQVDMHDMITVCIVTESSTSDITHIINGTGNQVGPSYVTTATANSLWTNPLFSTSAGLDATGTNFALTLPTESWHSYQLQYVSALTNLTWLNFGNRFGGDDTLETVVEPIAATRRFYRVSAQ